MGHILGPGCIFSFHHHALLWFTNDKYRTNPFTGTSKHSYTCWAYHSTVDTICRPLIAPLLPLACERRHSSVNIPTCNRAMSSFHFPAGIWRLTFKCFCYRPTVPGSSCPRGCVCVCVACEAPCFFFGGALRVSSLNRMWQLSENHGDRKVFM